MSIESNSMSTMTTAMPDDLSTKLIKYINSGDSAEYAPVDIEA